jgi:hypothetical protein
MRNQGLLVVAFAGLLCGSARAQETPALELPVGSRMRVTTRVSDRWTEGVLISADLRSLSFVPDGAPPLGDNRFEVPTEAVTRLEVSTGKKRQWLPGLLIGLGLGVAMGATVDVDAEQCELDDNYFCSRGEAIAAMSASSAGIGALIGSLIKKEIWTPVTLEALGPPREKARAEVGLRPVPGGVVAALSVQF